MLKTIAFSAALLTCATTAGATVNTNPTLYEETLAHQEEGSIILSPIGGIENRFWFTYRIKLVKARKDLTNDLRHAEKTRAIASAWDEYRLRLVHDRAHYVTALAKCGYRYGSVSG